MHKLTIMKCIYVRTNLVNGKQYVGQTNNFEDREYDWKHAKHYAGTFINRAKNKYGFEKFKTEIIRECQTQDELNQWEQYYIKVLNTKYPNGYNLTDGGGGTIGVIRSEKTRKKMSEVQKGKHIGKLNSFYGKHHSEEAKKKISEANKGRIKNEELKRKHSELMKGRTSPMKGKHHTEESKLRMKGRTAWNKGIPATEEQKRKQSIAMKGKQSPFNKKVYQYTLDGELVKIWNSTCECGKNGFHQGNVSACCRNEYLKNKNIYKGFIWKYKNDQPN